uniref:Eukaryotic translation elongation factor 1 gamma n=1 Tax=Latimeria chalumnae TaxID=7897 RepID=H3B467_LATCH
MAFDGGTLYTYPENWRAFKALIAAQYSGATVKVQSTPPQFHFGQSNKTPEFLQKFPLGKVPAFEGDDGFCVFESNAIAHYVSNDELRGSSKVAAAQVIQWMSFADSEIVPPASTWVFPTLGIMQYNKQATEHAKEEVKKVLGVLDLHLQTRTFLVGERVTLADIAVVCSLLWLYKQVLEPSFRQLYVNVNRWFVTCVNQPQFKAVLGEVKLCEKMAQFDAKKFAELQPKKEAPKKEKSTKEQKQQEKKQDKKKEEKKATAEEEMDESDQAIAAEPKPKDPFAHLPKSSFIMDEFKRKYSNEDTLTVALPYFWEHFDKEGWSIWYGEYKYPDELTQTFMSCNLISGMFQRLDKLRKTGFASVILFGSNNDSSISGIWVFRGQDLAFELSLDWQVDYESYSWHKLDVDSEECKTMVKEYFAWEGEFKHVGKPFNQGKIFK